MTPEGWVQGGQSGAHGELAGCTPVGAWHCQVVSTGSNLGQECLGLPGETRPAFRPHWVGGQQHRWQVLAPGPLHRKEVLSVMLWLRLGMETTVEGPPGQGWHLCCPLDPTLPSQTRSPLPSPQPPLAMAAQAK